MMMLAVLRDDLDDEDDETEAGSDYAFATSSVMTCASSVCQDIDMKWTPATSIKDMLF